MAEHWPAAVVFDLDGTLVDSVGDIADVLNAVLVFRSLPQLDESTVRSMVGGGARLLIERALRHLNQPVTASVLDAMQEAFEAEYSAIGTGRSSVFPGGRELIAALTAKCVRLGICTNKPLEVTTTVLDGLGISESFGAIVGETDRLPRKPDPAMLHAVLEQLGVHPDEAVMIGDSAIDVETARAAQVRVIAVSFGYTTIPAVELGADIVIDSLTQAEQALSQIRPR